MIIEIDGLSIEISKKSIKNINLRIDSQGKIKVSMPEKCSFDIVQHYLQTKRDWIIAHRARLLATPRSVAFTLNTGEYHFFLGKPYEWVVHENAKQNRIVIDEKKLHCFISATANFLTKKALLEQWYRQQMHALLPALIKKWETVIGVQVDAYGIKVMKTRWGSCNTRERRIWLTLYLIQKPLDCLEYVLVHEMVHLLEASHNQRFYRLMSQFMPNWRCRQDSLKTLSTLAIV